MWRIIFLPALLFIFFSNLKASEDTIEELNYARKRIVSPEVKSKSFKFTKGTTALSVGDVIRQVQEKIDPTKKYFLNLKDNLIDNESAIEILKFVIETPQIKRVDLSANKISQIFDTDELEKICRDFMSKRKDCTVILSGNNIPNLHFDPEDGEESAAPKRRSNIIIGEVF